jgi:hypothetical protein
MGRRLTILSLGRARAAWPRDVARWATAGLLPVEHHPCLSPEELDGRLQETGAADIVMLDGGLSPGEPHLIRRSAERGSAVLVIDDEPRNWLDLGAAAVAAPPTDPHTLHRLLEQLSPVVSAPAARHDAVGPRPAGRLIAVTGHGGAGASTIAHGLALRWGGAHGRQGLVLADLSLRADQHVHHDITDIGPGLLDLVAGHERSPLPPDDVVRCTRDTGQGHRLLTGVRHPRDRTALVPAAVGSALVCLRAAFQVVVADVDRDLDGRAEPGSDHIEERNDLTRAVIRTAGAVVVVARGDLLGLHRLCRQLEALTAAGLGGDHLSVVANGAGRRPPGPASLAREIRQLLGPGFDDLTVVTVPHLRGLEARRRDARPPGRRLTTSLRGLDHLVAASTGDGSSPPGQRPESVGAKR